MPLVAFGLTSIALRLLLDLGLASRLAIDRPNARSLHASPVPRAGGLVLVPVALASSAFLSHRPALLMGLAGVLCAISFIDDRWGLAIMARLAFHSAAAIILCMSVVPVPPVWGAVLATLTLVWAANLFNFMDGADGLAGGMALFGFGTLGWTMLEAMPGMAVLAFCVAAAAGGFLMFNFAPARVFMGDAGSVPLGFLAGATALAGWLQGVWPAWFPMLVFSPFVMDASATLLMRALRGERFWKAHRDHYYQRLVRMGWTHRRLALAEYALMATCSISALVLLQLSIAFQVGGVVIWIAIYLGLMRIIDARWSKCMACVGDGA